MFEFVLFGDVREGVTGNKDVLNVDTSALIYVQHWYPQKGLLKSLKRLGHNVEALRAVVKVHMILCGARGEMPALAYLATECI